MPLARGSAEHFYGTNEDQWTRLRLAALLDYRGAIESASWGRFQILGKNWMHTGAASLEAFLSIMFTSESSQLAGFVTFVNRAHLADALRRLDWRAFARGYNGKKFYVHDYDGKIARKYRELVNARALARR